jgi:hypothetical protein
VTHFKLDDEIRRSEEDGFNVLISLKKKMRCGGRTINVSDVI